MEDVLGSALLDYQMGKYSEDIITESSLDEKDTMPLPYLFRDFEDMPPLEKKALELCNGNVLDIGCGAGSHSLYLQNKGFEVTALDKSPGAIETCRLRGIQYRSQTDILHHKNSKYDTLLMLMNGIGVVGKLSNLGPFLEHLKSLLKHGGQILLDSSDIAYMFEDYDENAYTEWINGSGDYYGEVEFTMHYKSLKSEAFDWLYIDYTTLEKKATACGIQCELLGKGEHYDYLARLWQS